MSNKQNQQTKLSTASGFNTNNIIFSTPLLGSIPNSVPAITFKRILLSVTNPDGTVGELIMRTERLFSYGVSQNCDPKTQEVIGYSIPIVLHDRDAPTQAQLEFTTVFNNIVEKTKDHILIPAVKREIDPRGKIEERRDLKDLNPLYQKKVDGVPVSGSSPMLYTKLIHNKKSNKITSMFYDEEGTSLNPLDLVGKNCFITAAIKFESIFIGGNGKISFQVKLYEAEVELLQTGMRRLLPTSRPTLSESKVTTTTSTSNPLQSQSMDDSESDGSVSDEEENNGGGVAETKVSTGAPIGVKKMVKKVVKKN